MTLGLVTSSKIVLRGNTYLSSPPSSKLRNSRSVHVENFSRMYAASPTGESFKAQPETEEENVTKIVISDYWTQTVTEAAHYNTG